MKILKHLIITTATIIILLLMVATFVENGKGADFTQQHIYDSAWFVALWAIFAVISVAYMIKARLYRRITATLLHLSFLLILAGAFLSWLTAESGNVHLRKGVPAKEITLKDGSTVELEYTLTLKRFSVTHYPGTDAPMDYISEITAEDETLTISMNNIGKYHGYRFTQAGYDDDMQGTRLDVYRDPWGIGVTYAGYALLFLSILIILSGKGTSIRRFYAVATGTRALKGMAALLMLSASALSFAHTPAPPDSRLADRFGEICVLYNGRICPINTVATDFAAKLSGKPSWEGMTANQLFFGWTFDASSWEQAKVIEIKGVEAQKALGIEGSWASFADFWNEYNEYKLEAPLAEAAKKGDKKLLRQLREADEKFNVVCMLYRGELLRIFPCKSKDGKYSWLSPGERNNQGSMPPKEWYFVRMSMDYLAESIVTHNDERAFGLISKIADYQRIKAPDIMPTPASVKCELAYNTVNSQRWGIMLYLTLSLLLLIIPAATRNNQWHKVVGNATTFLTVAMLLHTTMLLSLRWFISGHIPLSNGYETMQFMAWATLLVCIAAKRYIPLVAKYGTLLASMALLVAMITDSNPQITPLMPVLQSPLLSIHVMVLMFSYAMFGLIALTGIQGIVSLHRHQTEKSAQLAALEMFLLYPAVALLTAGIFIGAIWANSSWGRYWSWDPKEVWALITMLIYAVPLHKDIKLQKSPSHIHWFMIAAFLSVLMTYFGVNYFLTGMHSYA